MDRKNYLIASLALLVLAALMLLPIFWPAIAYAQDAAAEAKGGATDYLKVVADAIIPTFALVLAGVVAALMKIGLNKLKEKYDFDIGQAAEQGLLQAVDRGISYAEEKAVKALKLGEGAPDGAGKLQSALEYVESEVQRLGYDEMARDKLVELIEAELNKKRARGEVEPSKTPPVPKKAG